MPYCSDLPHDTIKGDMDGTRSMGKKAGQDQFGEQQIECVIYPNPANDELNIQSTAIELPVEVITIRDISGRVVFNEKVNKELYHKISITNLTTGLYTIQINNKYNYKVFKR